MTLSSNKKTKACLILCVMIMLKFFGGCCNDGQITHKPDIRERLLANVRQTDKQFPDGKAVKLTTFAYLGRTKTKEGFVYIVEQRQVLTGMPCPRGAGYILFFNNKEKLVAKERLHDAQNRALWCNDGILYLWGLDTDGDKSWNAWDISGGISKRKRIIKPEYGSWLPDEPEE